VGEVEAVVEAEAETLNLYRPQLNITIHRWKKCYLKALAFFTLMHIDLVGLRMKEMNEDSETILVLARRQSGRSSLISKQQVFSLLELKSLIKNIFF
jgi:hypothetical protein